MRKLFLFLSLILCLTSSAQNSLWFEKGKGGDTRLVFEYKDIKENVFNYLYTEANIDHNKNTGAYILASRDQKWWDNGIWVHAEIRTIIDSGGSYDGIWMIGPMFTLAEGKRGFLNLQTLYRYDGRNDYQVTLMGDLEYGRLLYSMFADTYGCKKVFTHSENRFFFKVVDPLRVGCNLVVTLNEIKNGVDVKPLLVARIDL